MPPDFYNCIFVWKVKFIFMAYRKTEPSRKTAPVRPYPSIFLSPSASHRTPPAGLRPWRACHHVFESAPANKSTNRNWFQIFQILVIGTTLTMKAITFTTLSNSFNYFTDIFLKVSRKINTKSERDHLSYGYCFFQV